MNSYLAKSVLSLLGFSFLMGCSTLPTQALKPDDPNFAPVPSQSLAPPPVQGGAIFSTSNNVGLFSDKNARRVGDIITVILAEQTSSKKSSKSNSSKNTSVGLTAPVVGGTPLTPLSATVANKNSFSGSGGADQSNSLDGNITVTIAEVFPNGVLSIRGEKWLTLNNGDEFIRVSGLVRPDDINLDNTVSSQKLADARITYSGTGTFANANTQGWMTKFFNSKLWPF